jgi:RNA recognition motif. (a.k.a. RRM, RBD, or RNP domain)
LPFFIRILQRSSLAEPSILSSSSRNYTNKALTVAVDPHILPGSLGIYFQYSASDQAYPGTYWIACWHDPNRLDKQEAFSMPRMYVGNLASSVTSRDLLEHFSRAGGAIRALALTDRVSGLCRGFGFVEMAEISDVAVAFSLLNNSELNGLRIRIEPEPSLRNGKARNRDLKS